MKRVAIYIRVSTSKQDTDNQRRELEAVAKRSGWQIVEVFEDAGISGAKGNGPEVCNLSSKLRCSITRSAGHRALHGGLGRA
jgi:DNA invertase Pin-like site-specific DNA recombinase